MSVVANRQFGFGFALIVFALQPSTTQVFHQASAVVQLEFSEAPASKLKQKKCKAQNFSKAAKQIEEKIIKVNLPECAKKKYK